MPKFGARANAGSNNGRPAAPLAHSIGTMSISILPGESSPSYETVDNPPVPNTTPIQCSTWTVSFCWVCPVSRLAFARGRRIGSRCTTVVALHHAISLDHFGQGALGWFDLIVGEVLVRLVGLVDAAGTEDH